MTSLLDQLREMTVVVADTGDIGAIEKLKPVDCTTNPSLLLKAASTEGLAPIVDEAVAWGGNRVAQPRMWCRRSRIASPCRWASS
jgi:transaldolase